MGRCIVFNYGVDAIIYITGNDTPYSATGAVVYFGGGAVIQFWGNFLPVAEIEIFARDMAFVRYWWNSVFLFCGSIRCNS